MTELGGKKGKILAVLVVVLVISAIAVAIVMSGGTTNDGNGDGTDEDTVVSNQIEASAMIGELGWEALTDVAVDDNGDVFVLGRVEAAINSTTSSAADKTYGGYSELILAKYSSDLETMLLCTYLGGSGEEMSNEILIGSDGYIYVAGGTTSTDFPVTDGAAIVTGPAGLGDTVWTNFVCRFTSDLSEISACTYIGGVVDDPCCQLALTSSNKVIVGSTSDGTGSNGTLGAFSETPSGLNDIFITILSADLSDIDVFTYLGGSERDRLYDMTIDDQGDILLACGTTRKVDDPAIPFPITNGTYRTESDSPGYGGNIEGIVVRFSADLSELKASTYFGSDDTDLILGICIDPEGGIVICGQTSGEIDTTEGAYATSKVTTLQGFVAKLDADLTEVTECTYIGTGTTYILSIQCDDQGRIYLHGMTGGFPTTEGAISETYGGYNSDMFLAQLSSNLAFLRSSTYLGGNYDEGDGYGMTVSANDTVYIAGWTTSTNFPAAGMGNTTADHADGFVLKITFG